MDALLQAVLDANGGIARWETASTITARIEYGGPFWEFKGQPEFAGHAQVEARVHEEWIRFTQEGSGVVMVYDKNADTVTVSTAEGAVIDSLDHPRATFDGYDSNAPWTQAQMAYFRAYATWHYLVEPLIFTMPGVEAHEIESWNEGDATWRVLSVTFPDTIDTHNATQLYYYDEQLRFRRMDYAPVVNGGSPTAHYIRESIELGGLQVPTKRHIHIRNDDRTPDLSWVPITLDLQDVAVA
ncbi:hypothetical protein N1027_03485 [Herbiconiux sp. CPCC 205763]|uniref:Uncharacterized protein n=1 Tax=Herbiconiux aconitum TaxID=2970913 RepID=A0ABT2GLV5_9MICO|nr:hypothetical protein [Herbiconiux aconitum]MCS5717194.1 hypothetical protein [Herbiconiux aconitum]